jgi:predicted lipoprotein with Yx(FWY)xxD motif
MKAIARGLQLSVAGAAIGAAAMLSACGSGHSAQSAGPAAHSASGAKVDAVKLSAASTLLGTIVVDGAGSSLYRFDKDSAHPSVSHCLGACATAWPPVTVAQGASIQLLGVQKSDVGSIMRTDGTVQLTVGGWPVYRYALDQKPGDIKGQGIGGTWFAVTPSGAKASGANATDGTSESGGSGY